jgi:hypothetical protein
MTIGNDDDMMVDEEETEEETEEDGGGQGISSSFMLAIGDMPVPPLQISLFAHGYPEWAFVQARVPLEDEDTIRNAGSHIDASGLAQEMGNREQRRAAGKRGGRTDDMGLKVTQTVDKWFLAKCRYQVTGFKLLGTNPDGTERIVEFDAAKSGNNEANRAMFRNFLRPQSLEFRRLVENYLDWVAGRTDEFAEDFAKLGNAPTP